MNLFLRFIQDHRYKEILRAELELRGYSYSIIELELIDLPIPSTVAHASMKAAFRKYDLGTAQSKQRTTVSRIRCIVAGSIRGNVSGPPYIKYPELLSKELGHSYAYLSALYSKTHGHTLQQHIIAQRIEVVKEMLLKEDVGLSEIAWRMGYSSVAHLSNQFKNITGVRPTAFKAMGQIGEIPTRVLCEACKEVWVEQLEQA